MVFVIFTLQVCSTHLYINIAALSIAYISLCFSALLSFVGPGIFKKTVRLLEYHEMSNMRTLPTGGARGRRGGRKFGAEHFFHINSFFLVIYQYIGINMYDHIKT